MPSGPCASAGRGADSAEIDNLALRLGNDLVFDHKNVACPESLPLGRQRLKQFFSNGVTRFDFVGIRNGDDSQFGRMRHLFVHCEGDAARQQATSELL